MVNLYVYTCQPMRAFHLISKSLAEGQFLSKFMQQNRKPDITSTQKDKSYVFCQLKDFSLEKYEDVVLVDCVTPNSPADQSDVRKVRTNQIVVLIVGEYQLQIKC